MANRLAGRMPYTGGFNLSESLKEKQARYREAREKRAGAIGPCHEQLIETIAFHVGLKATEVTEFVLDSEDQIQLMTSFVSAGGRRSLVVLYQKGEAPKLESGRLLLKQEIINKVIVTSGAGEACKGKIILLIKSQNDRNLGPKSMNEEVSYGILDLEYYKGLIPALKSLLAQVNLPQMNALSDWGPMLKTLQGHKNKDAFMQGFEAFINYLETASASIKGAIHLTDVIEVDVSHITCAHECKEASNDVELVGKLEELVLGWRTQIEYVLGQNEQMRKEADDTGPMAELEYWQCLTSKFNSLFINLKSQKCRAAINTLNAAKSKVVRSWKDMDAKITDIANEAKDNVRYLYALENECGKLVHAKPLDMVGIIPSLINIITMIRDVSRYYNSAQRITSLFVKITNQMVNGCRKYLTNNNRTKIWDQEPEAVRKHIDECLYLLKEYKKAFRIMNQPKKSADSKEAKPELSEMYIFGKFETFSKRLMKLRDYLENVDKFTALSTSGMEGIEPLGNKLQGLITAMKKKQYDILDFRKPDFEDDYAIFRKGICELENMISALLEVAYKRTKNTCQALVLLKKFENFNIYCLKDVIADKYFHTLSTYTAEIEDIKKRYQKLREEPPVPRNMPPVTGKVLWARQLFRKIREPMEAFLKHSPEILKGKEGKKICHSYNMVGKALMEFEVLYYRAWCKEADNIKNCLQATLLYKNESKDIFLNFDPQISEMTRESVCMQKMGLELPLATIELLKKSDVLKSCKTRLSGILEDYTDLKESIPPVFLPSLKNQLKGIERAVSHGLIFATWSSLNHEAYFLEIERKLFSVRTNVESLVEMRKTRILATCTEIVETEYLDMEQTYPVHVFVKRLKQETEYMTQFLNTKCEYLENATKDLVGMLRKFSQPNSAKEETTDEAPAKSANKEKDKEEEQFQQECAEMVDFFKIKTYDAMVKAIRLTLEALKKRSSYVKKSAGGIVPLLETNVELCKPNVELKPSIDELQTTIYDCARMIVEVSKGIPLWAGDQEEEAAGEHNLYKIVADNKDVTKILMMLSSGMNNLKTPVQQALTRFHEFKFLWENDLPTAMQKFSASKPLIVDYKAEILVYYDCMVKIDAVDSKIIVGPLSLVSANVKVSLKKEAMLWKKNLCILLNAEYKQKMYEVSSTVEDYLKKFSRPIRDLDDIRESMSSLDKLRNEFIRIDFLLGPIEETYALLQRFGHEIKSEEQSKADTLHYDWDRLIIQQTAVADELMNVQATFRADLIDKISQFQIDLQDFQVSYETEGPMEPGISAQEASDRVQVFSSELSDLNRKFTAYASGEELFGLEVRDYPFLQKVKREMAMLQKLYGLYQQVMKAVNGYYEILWSELDVDYIVNELAEFQNRCKKLPKGLKEWPAFNVLKSKIDDFSETCPLLVVMAHPAMQKRHWARLAEQCRYVFDVANENYTLKSLMAAPLLQNKEEIEEICISAVKEKDIEAKLQTVISEWTAHRFYFGQFKTRGELLLKGGETVELIGFLEDSLMVLGSLMSNRYNAPFKPLISLWVQKLSNTNDIIENWMVVQNLWVYLEAVFVGGDIAKELPQEAKRFQNIDKTWIKLMARARDIKLVVNCCVSDETMGQTLPHLLEQLECCQKSLTGYLEAKRLLFPRFFFISDPSLLEILGQASDSHSIQAHLSGIFENVYLVGFHETEYDKIISVISREKEEIPLKKPVMAKGHVEIWIGELLDVQQASLHAVICDAYMQMCDPEYKVFEYLDTAPAQVGLLALQMLWTRDSETALENARTDRKIMNFMNNKFLQLLNDLIGCTTRDLGKFERIKYETFITIHVHQRDIFNDLVRMKVKELSDFEWLKQSRFYFNLDIDVCIVAITNVNFGYQNEFLGCTDRLVITPLTDRCYITLAQAMEMHMGAAPAGPAGTGKTETTKDMGKALGKYVVVFNCSDQMDFRGLGRIYKGLAQSGSWGCFDEFNRIDLPVLSVAAQQIYIVLQAKKDHKTLFVFTDGDNVSLNPEFGLFITMNPGYAGRQELPENLKVQFRTVSMMVPDRQIIMRVKLASCGFVENIVLAQKFFTLYKLCEEQLTKQVHYDFGLRNILSVLRTLGAAKRKRPDDSETTIVMRGLRDMNLSKLVDEDEPLFLSLISDLFPGIILDTAVYVDLQQAIQGTVGKMGLVDHPPWNLKVVQLFESQNVRHGMMTLGPSGAGKTMCIHMIMKALTICGSPHKEVRMNPKSITAPQMFGRLDVATNDWTDGIFSTLWRRSHKTKKGENLWLLLDGPVDAIWIENLNSVLDDNKTLTLANGDRIVMAANCKILFEVHNIDNASPATVSRVGMVFMSSSVLNWRPILDGWLKSRPAYEVDLLRGLFHSIFEDLYTFVVNNLLPKMNLYECNYIVQAQTVLEGCIPAREECGKNFTKHVQQLFVFALMWSCGALLELEDRHRLQQFIVTHKSKLAVPKMPEGSGRTIFEYVPNLNGTWDHWDERLVEYVYPRDHVPNYTDILVPNVDNVRTRHLIDIIARQGKAVLLIGEQGTGKTVVVKGYMNDYDPDIMLSKALNFSSATDPGMFQTTIESYVDKRMGSTYGPPGGRKMTVFIDDINMPIINDWGDQITNEVVRQQMEQRGMYSIEKPGDFNNIVDLQFIAAMIHPGGGRNDIPERLKRQFTIFNCTLPSNASIDKIFDLATVSRNLALAVFRIDKRSRIGDPGDIRFNTNESIAIGGYNRGGYFCEERNFTEAIVEFVPRLVPVTRLLWQATKLKLLATPAKFHYIFNLRDLSRIWQGILCINAEVVTTDLDMLQLFKHECMRVIADRFVNEDDNKWFTNKMTMIIRDTLGDEYANYAAGIEPYFVDFLREVEEPDEEGGGGGGGDEEEEAVITKFYEPIPAFDEFSKVLMNKMAQYNENVIGAKLDLVFFKDAMTHLIKISRIIRTPRGSALLVGVGGSGKQSLTKLATFIAGYESFQIVMSNTYNSSNLLEDLKTLYRKAGCKGVGVSFIFTDNDIKEEGYLEYLNNILSTGEVSGLFARDELDEILNDLINVLKKEDPKKIPTQEVLYEYFMSRAKSNLHIVLCFSPIGEKFRTRALKFPGLFSCCTMDWFTKWPREALVSVSKYFTSKIDIRCGPELKERLYGSMGSFHDTASSTCIEYFDRFRRVTHVTPKSYLSFLSGYPVIYFERYGHLAGMSTSMDIGLQKLLEAGESVGLLSVELVIKEQDLAIAAVSVEKGYQYHAPSLVNRTLKSVLEVLTEVMESATAAEVIKNEVLIVKHKAQGIVDLIAVEKVAAEEKLQAAEPALLAAEEALNTIKGSDMATVRKLAKPPHLIMRIMDCVLILFRVNINRVEPDPEKPWLIKPSWSESLKVMSSSGFMGNLKYFDKETINAETIDLLSVYFESDDYNYDNAKKVCGNVAGLLSWTIAMSSFYSINKEVLPLKAKLAKAEAKLQVALKDLAQAQALLDEKQAELDATKAKFDSAMRMKQLLIEDAEMCRYKMSMATQLINGLSGEKVRWTAQSKQFKLEILALIGDVLLACGFLSYAGPFNQDFRTYLIKEQWEEELKRDDIPFTPNLNLINMLSDINTITEWASEGLPNDDLSIQNGIIVTKASRYPLLIDPQGQGKTWIKSREEKNQLIVTTLTHKYFKNHLEDALGQGRPLLIQDINEEVDPALDNVLEKNFIKAGRSLKVKVGDKECDVMEGFKLYLTTKRANPCYTPELSARTSIINFTVTMQGLEDQLLGRVVLTEKPELETEKLKLVEDVSSYKCKMKELEGNLLHKLSSTEGSLVEDVSLIDMLNHTKETANEVSEKLTIAAETEIKINGTREEFRPVATRGSILYFLIVEMSLVNLMYQTSLNQFLGLFDDSMKSSARSPVTSKRINIIIDALTYIVFRYSCRGLFNAHKLLFTLMMAFKIDIRKGKIKSREFQTFIKGGAALDLKSVQPKPCKWILDVTWLNLVQLSKLPEFRDILDQITRNEKQWRQWFDAEAPETEVIPDGYNASLDVFRRLILIRCWCIDRVLPQARLYISGSLGKKYAEPVILDMEELHAESATDVPMICFLSQGSDPTEQICVLAKRKSLECQCISMGQGQEIHGRKLLANCFKTGNWALFQNCHLGINFMNELLDKVTNVEDPAPTFRLWITAEEHPKFPIQLLQSSIKFTNDPPLGVRAGLLRTFAGIPQDFIDATNMPQWRPTLYAVGFLHTVVQERRKFGPMGWNIPYEFNSSDHYATTLFVQTHLDEIDKKKGVDWNTVRYMIAEVQYGGRVTDDYDKHLLKTFSKVWFSEDMFKETFTFYGQYTIPAYKTSKEVMDAIDSLPDTDTPEVFGLHKNAEITYQANTADIILQTIMDIQPKDGGGGAGESREVVVFRQCEDMLSKLSPDYIQHQVRTRLAKMGLHNSLVIFLKQELQRMQRVITRVRITLTDLMLAVEGTIIMSESLREALDSLFDAKCPTMWTKISWISSSIGFWFTELLERNTQLQGWVFQARPICFWMTGFFNPQGFLTAMRQEVTRMHKGWALDTVALHNDVLKVSKEDLLEPPKEGLFVYGLYIDGAAWDRRTAKIIESSPKILFVQMPVVHVYAINSLAPKNPDLYQCPVYKKPRRQDLTYITPLWLKTNKPPSHWTLRGVALLCDIK